MNKKGLKTLEYNKIIEMLKTHASTELGRTKCEKLLPMDKLFDINLAQQETEDSLKRILKDGNISFAAKRGDLESLIHLSKGSSLTSSELLSIAALLDNVSRVKSYGGSADEYSDSLSDYFTVLAPLTTVLREIRRCIIAVDEIADDASSNLRDIRRKQKSVNDRIHTQLSKMVSDTYRSYLQDAVITMRDGRYCIPVKAEHKSNVPGMIHDQSATASTFFIEPAAVVAFNNELRELEIEETKEIQVILASLSALCEEHSAELKSNIEVISTLDFIFAKGAFALSLNATRPIYNEDGIIDLRKARHPLLDKKKAVPINVRLGKEYDLLIITGPNTGGKTVSLKTVGLLTLMGQSGLHIPAADRSELSIFEDVFADIGDEQSIEQSLSTFSSHMKTIVEILKLAGPKSLCLFDELGAGTDPTEGAALAIAILSTLHESKIRTMATTHYSELKIFALNTQGVENGSCEFDVDSLSPTYRLLIGIPGKSNAFAISSKLGLSDKIIERAREQISESDSSFEDVLTELEKNRIIMEEEQRKIASYKHDIEVLKDTYEQRKNKLNESRDKIIEEAKEEARQILKEAKDLADAAIKDIRKGGRGNIDKLESTRGGLRKAMNDNQGKGLTAEKVNRPQNKASDFTIGTDVRIISMDLTGHVHSKPDSKGNLSVQCGIINMNANINDLEIIMSKDESTGKSFSKKFAKSTSTGLSKSSSISAEINLIGKKVDEALPILEKYLDDAYLSHLSTVRIVHGKGTGALRNAVVSHLKRVSYIASYRAGEFGEGDAGVTIVEFK